MAIRCSGCGRSSRNLGGMHRHIRSCKLLHQKGCRAVLRKEEPDDIDKSRLEEIELRHQNPTLRQHLFRLQQAEAGISPIDTDYIDDNQSANNTYSGGGSRLQGIVDIASGSITKTFRMEEGETAGRIYPTWCKEDQNGFNRHSKYRRTSLTIEEILDPTNFYPFLNEVQFSLAEWFVDAEVGQNKVAKYINNPLIHPPGSIFDNPQHFKQLLESIPYGINDDAWIDDMIEIPGQLAESPLAKYPVHYRDIMQTIGFLISYLPFADYLHYAPEHVYALTEEGEPSERIYSGLHTGDWWWNIQRSLPEGATVVPLLLSTDKTQLTEHRGDRNMWPIYLSIGNLDGEIRRSQKLPGTIVIGSIPIMNDANGMNHKNRLYHATLQRLLKRIVPFSRQGIRLQCADGMVRLCFPIICGFSIDYEEQVVVTGVKSGEHCPICEVPPQERQNLRGKWPRRTHASTQARIKRQRADNLSIKEAMSVHDIANFAWEHWHVNIHETMMLDILHQLYKGLAIYMKDWVLRTLAEDPNTAGRRQKTMAGEKKSIETATIEQKLDFRFQQVSLFTGLKHFHDRKFSQVKQWTGNEYRDMNRQYAAVVTPLLMPKKPDVMAFVRAVLDFITLAEYRSHTDTSLTYLTNALERIHDTIEQFRHLRISVRNVEGDFNIPKLHALTHYVDWIKLYGSAVDMSTSVGENAHKILIKAYYDRTNKQSTFEQQIFEHNIRRVNLQAMQGIITYRLSTASGADPASSQFDSRPNKLARSTDFDQFEWPLDNDDATSLMLKRLPSKQWRFARQVEAYTGIEDLIDALAIFIRERRRRHELGNVAPAHEEDRREPDPSWVRDYPLKIHPSLECFKVDGKDVSDPTRRVPERIRCQPDWRSSKKWRRDYVWVQEYSTENTAREDVPEYVKGKLIGQVMLLVTVRDMAHRKCNGKYPEYHAALLSTFRLRHGGRPDPVHGMIEIEIPPKNTARSPRYLGRNRFYDLPTIDRSAHIVPATLTSGTIFYVNNYIDWDQYNTLYDPDWMTRGKQIITKVKKNVAKKRVNKLS